MHTRHLAWLAIAGLLAIVESVEAQAPVPFKVFRARGTVNVKNKDGTWRTIPKAEKVDLDEEIKTGPDGEALIESESPEGEMKLGLECETHAEYEEDMEGKLKIPRFNLKQGSAYCSVLTKAKKAGVTFKIQSDVGVGGVIGTEFLFTAKSNAVDVVVSESSVVLSDCGPKKTKVRQNYAGYIYPWDAAVFTGKGTAASAKQAEADALRVLSTSVLEMPIDDKDTVESILQTKARIDRLQAQLLAAAEKKSVPAESGMTRLELKLAGAALKKMLAEITDKPLGDLAVWTTTDLPPGAMEKIATFRSRFREAPPPIMNAKARRLTPTTGEITFDLPTTDVKRVNWRIKEGTAGYSPSRVIAERVDRIFLEKLAAEREHTVEVLLVGKNGNSKPVEVLVPK